MSSMQVSDRVDPLVVWLGMYAQGEGLSMVQLARLAGVSDLVIQSWVSGRRAPMLGNIRAAANVLGYDLALKPLTHPRVQPITRHQARAMNRAELLHLINYLGGYSATAIERHALDLKKMIGGAA